jgi:ADP-heptose:LPS heptosyltransferase
MDKRILINFPTNLGDVFMALPALDFIKVNCPGDKITAIASQATKDMLSRHSHVDKTILFDKRAGIGKKIKFVLSLWGKYEVAVDFKNTAIPALINCKNRTPFRRNKYPKNMHLKDKYLKLAQECVPGRQSSLPGKFILTKEEESRLDALKLPQAIFIAGTSLSSLKQYPYESIKALVSRMNKKYPLVILGKNSERDFYKDILSIGNVIDLVGKTQMWELPHLISRYAMALVGVDSGILHLASYLGTSCVALFGPTPPERSRPSSDKSVVLTNRDCPIAPCDMMSCGYNNVCMKIDAELVATAVENILM